MIARRCMLVLVLVGLVSCASDTAPAMPDVTGKRLDVAKSDLKGAGVDDKVEVVGGGLLGVLDESNWQVCEQTPLAGKPLDGAPRLTIDRTCGRSDAAPSQVPSLPTAPSSSTPPSPSAGPGTPATDTTVDALLDRLNAVNSGGIRVGDRFRVTGELFEDDAWGVGATGDYAVYLRAKAGRDDLLVFVDRRLTMGWRNGGQVEMLIKVVEKTINGETTGGWLQAEMAHLL